MSFEEMHKYDVAEAARKGVEWSKKSQHADLTYPMNKTAKLYNFPESEEAIKAAKKANAAGAGDNFIAVINNQGRLEQMMRMDDFMAKKLPGSEATYQEKDSFSWIEPYYPRDHAYTWPQYQVSNESAYLNDVPAGQHQAPYDTMESIRSRYSARLGAANDTRAYGNENITDTFRSIGLYNNNSASLDSANSNAAAATTTPPAGAAFLARRSKLPGSEATYIQPDSFSWIEPYYPRDHAYTWPQYQVSNESAYLNDVPAGQHQYPYDTMESIRARYASRINGTYTNEQMTDVFKGLGLYNNDSSSLTSANAAAAATSGGDAAGGAFIATGKKLPGPEATYRQEDSFSWIEPYYPRDHAYTWPQYQVSNESAYLNDAPAGQHHYPYDTMESIRSRYQSRLSDNNDTRAYGNDNITATFRSLGLYNNDSSTLQAAAPAGGDAAGGSFIATKLRDPAAAATPAADPNAGKLHFYRHDAWNEANLNATHQKEYGTNPLTAHGATLPEHSTAGYVVEPLNIDAGQGGAAPAAAFIYSRGEPTLHFYRHEAWNEANLNATHQKEYALTHLLPMELLSPSTLPTDILLSQ
jgi:hypothetical protein